MKNKRTCLVIAGMHRSGTSALTRCLSLLGADLPKTIMPATVSNQTGHWESDSITAYNDSLLRNIGSVWHDWTPCIDNILNSNFFENEFEEAKKVFLEEFGNSSFMVLKDPRICRLMPFWLSVINSFDIEAKIILPVRNPIEVAESHRKRDGMDVKYGMLLWLRHVLDAEYFSRGFRRVFTTYEQLLENWQNLITNVENNTEINFPLKNNKKSIVEIENYVSSKYRHNNKSDDSVFNDVNIDESIKTTYSLLRKWSTFGEDQNEYRVLDDLRRSIDGMSKLFDGLVKKAAFVQSEIDEINKDCSKLKDENLSLNTEVARLINENVAKDNEILEIGNRVKTLNIEIEEVNLNNENLIILNDELKSKNLEQKNKIEFLNNLNKGFEDNIKKLDDAIIHKEKIINKTADELKANLLENDKLKNIIIENENLLDAAYHENSNIKIKLDSEINNVILLRNENAKSNKIITNLKEDNSKLNKTIIGLSDDLTECLEARKTIAFNLENITSKYNIAISELIRLNDSNNIIVDYLLFEGRSFLNINISNNKIAEILRKAQFVNEDWYLAQNPDVEAKSINATLHYVVYGKKEGRLPRDVTYFNDKNNKPIKD